MHDLETSFHKLLGRAPTEIEKNRLYRVKDALDLEADDSLWVILMALDYYVALYEKIPKELAGATEPLRELGNAPAIVQALKDTTKATKDAQGLWNKLTERGLAWGLAIGIGGGLIIGTTFGLYVLTETGQSYRKWELDNQLEEMRQQRAWMGDAYDALKYWKKLGLHATNKYIVINSDKVVVGTNDNDQTGIWIKDK